MMAMVLRSRGKTFVGSDSLMRYLWVALVREAAETMSCTGGG